MSENIGKRIFDVLTQLSKPEYMTKLPIPIYLEVVSLRMMLSTTATHVVETIEPDEKAGLL